MSTPTQVTDEDRRAAEEFAGLVYLSVLQHTALEKAFAAHRLASERRAYEKAGLEPVEPTT